MDPALWELLGRDGDPSSLPAGEIEAIVRLDAPDAVPAGARLVARFGRVATCRLPPSSVLGIRADEHVRSLKAGRRLVEETEPVAEPASGRAVRQRRGDRRRPSNLALTGTGVVVGVVDWGCDVDHPNLQRPDGTTRLLALWDQRGADSATAPQPYGYGTVHFRQQIDHALRSGRPYEALDYHPGDFDRSGAGSHGSHVLDIAAGNGRDGGPVGLAPAADLVFVQIANRNTRGLATLGDSVRLLEAVDFVRRVSAHRPWVINISIGNCGGAHDGSSLVELALDELLGATPGRAVCMSAGNYFAARTHSSLRARGGAGARRTFVVDADDRTSNELEVWYAGSDEFAVSVASPSGRATGPVRLGSTEDIADDGRPVGRIYHRAHDPNNGDHHIDLFLYPSAPPGAWVVTFEPVRIRNGALHAWLERDDRCRPCQARFVAGDADTRSTTGTIANGRLPLAVGAYDAHSERAELAEFSSSGPTRDGRRKPDLVAPGVGVLAARSAAAGSVRSAGLLTRKSGTSMAAPHVAGAVALCLEAKPHLWAAEIRDLVLATASPPPDDAATDMRYGSGCLDVDRLVAAVRRHDGRSAHRRQPEIHQQRSPLRSEELTMTTPDLAHLQPVARSLDADRVYRELTYRPGGPIARRIGSAYTVLARPGEVPGDPPRSGDLLVRVCLGIPGAGHVAVLAEAPVAPSTGRDRWAACERAGPGMYATVVDEGPPPPLAGDRVARRVLDRAGTMPPGQLLLRPATSHALGGDPPGCVCGTAGDGLDLGEQVIPLTGPLSEAEWGLVETWLAAGAVGTDELIGDAEANATLVAGAIFCGRKIGTPDTGDDPLLCVDPSVTAADARVILIRRHLAERGPIVNWASVPAAARRVRVMELLVDTYGYPVNGAAGLVGNLYVESAVLPNRVEGSRAATPMRARDFRGVLTDFSAAEVMNRSRPSRRGPRRPGVGLAQWTTRARRAGLFLHRHGSKPSGSRILFDLDAQVDYLVNELRTSYPAVDGVLTDPAVTIDDASDDVVYRFEIPGSILHNGVRLPRSHPAVQRVFRDRRRAAHTALTDYRAAHPAPATPASAVPVPAEPEAAGDADGEGIWDVIGDIGDRLGSVWDLWRFLSSPPLQAGSTGDAVEFLQRALARLGHAVAVTGTFDAATTAAVTEFQRRHDLCAGAIVGVQTKEAVLRALRRLVDPAALPLADEIVRIAREQLPRWNTGGHLLETDVAATPILQEYYRDGVCRSVSAADAQNPAWQNRNFWSSVFVSWVMRSAGAGPDFAYSEAHREYIRAARTNRCENNTANPFWAYRAAEVAPQLGDVVCRSRAAPLATYENVMQPTNWALHCDIVTALTPGGRLISVTGGNVAVPGGNPNAGRTVAERQLRVGADGLLDLTGNQSRYFAVVRCRGAAPGVPQPC